MNCIIIRAGANELSVSAIFQTFDIGRILRNNLKHEHINICLRNHLSSRKYVETQKNVHFLL